MGVDEVGVSILPKDILAKDQIAKLDLLCLLSYSNKHSFVLFVSLIMKNESFYGLLHAFLIYS